MQIKTADFLKSSSVIQECPPAKLPEYAFIGRSNVGKSSLINHLTNRKKLAKTSSTPGKTQLINHFLINEEWYLVDLPGYGWAQTSKTNKAAWKKMINTYLEERTSLACVFVLIDIRHDPQPIDLEFMQWLGEHQIPFSMVFTKSDKLKKSQIEPKTAAYKKEMLRTWEALPQIFITSSVDRLGGNEILEFIEGINKEIRR